MDYIKTYSDKAQKIIAQDDKERAAIRAEVETKNAVIADAEAAMQAAVDAADRAEYEKQAKVKADAETAIQWDELRLDKLRNGHSMDEKEYRAALEGIETQKKNVDAAAMEKIQALASQIIQIAGDADDTVRKGDAVRADLIFKVFRERHDDGSLFSVLDASSGYVPRVRGVIQWAKLIQTK